MAKKYAVYGIYVLLCFSLFLLFFHPINALNSDLGRHLKLGEIISKTYQIPKTNLFSYTYPTYPFINHHWLSEVMMYHVFTSAGGVGLLFIFSLLAVISYIRITLPLIKKIPLAVMMFLSLLYIPILFDRTDLRPEIISFLFISIFITLLYQQKIKPHYIVLFLIPLQILWTNMHIYFFLGPAFCLLFVIDHMWQYRKYLHLTEQTKILLLTTVGVLLATCINPNGISGTVYPITTFINYKFTYNFPVEETQSIVTILPHDPTPGMYLFIITSIFLCLLFWRYKQRTSLIDWLLLLTAIIAGTAMIRNIPLLFYCTYIPAAYVCSSFYQKISYGVQRIMVSVVLIIFFCEFILLISQKGIGLAHPVTAEKALDFFLQQHIKGPILNNYNMGSYLIYRLYPQEKVFIDERPEGYPGSFFKDVYLPLQQNPAIFTAITEKYHINAIIVSYIDQNPQAKAFFLHLGQNPMWKLVFVDHYAAIFVKNSPQNQSIIQQFALSDTIASPSLFDIRQPKDLLAIGYLFQRMGWKIAEKNLLIAYLQQEPKDCIALKELVNLLQVNNPTLLPGYQLQLQQACQ